MTLIHNSRGHQFGKSNYRALLILDVLLFMSMIDLKLQLSSHVIFESVLKCERFTSSQKT